MPIPKYSFIIPVLNGEKTLSITLRSILRQTLSSFELIVVDNASTDRTKDIIREFPVAKYIHCQERGRSHARNRGARLARGKYLAFIDADVAIAPNWLEQVDRVLLRLPLDALATSVRPYHERDSALDRYRREFFRWKSQNSFLSIRSRNGAYPLINTAACVVDKKSFERVNGFDQSLKRHEDLDLSFRLFAQGYLLGGVSHAISKVRFTADRDAPLARELAYLRRSFEVQSMHPGNSFARPVNLSLLKEIWERSHCPSTLTFGLLNEAARQLGSLHQKLQREERPRIWHISPGRNLLASIFSQENERFFLKPGLNFLFINSSVFLCNGPLSSKRLSPMAAQAIRNLYFGRAISSHEKKLLLQLGAFQAAAGINAEEKIKKKRARSWLRPSKRSPAVREKPPETRSAMAPDFAAH